MRRETPFHQMRNIGIPLIYIRGIMALYSGISGSIRGPNGFPQTSPIAQGTREVVILRPLLFLIFFGDAMRVVSSMNLDEGAIIMGALSLVKILFADDVVLLARCISDILLLNALSEFCHSLHEQIVSDKLKRCSSDPSRAPFLLATAISMNT